MDFLTAEAQRARQKTVKPLRTPRRGIWAATGFVAFATASILTAR